MPKLRERARRAGVPISGGPWPGCTFAACAIRRRLAPKPGPESRSRVIPWRSEMTETERLMTITHDEYASARNALDTLVRERAVILPRGLDELREWLAAGAGERWRQHEEVVQQARLEDQALSMWWEYEWRRERKRRQRAEKKARAAEGSMAIPAPLEKLCPGGVPRPAPPHPTAP